MAVNNENPYQSPDSDVAQAPTNGLDRKTFNHLAKGQKLAIYSIAMYLFAALVANSANPLYSPELQAASGLAVVVALLLALAGLVRILMGAKLGIASKVLLFIGMFIPIVNLLALARISNIATKELRNNGYKVGFLGVKGRYEDSVTVGS